jgi:16S rRNA (cytosine967-C5)-methyltransferase
LKGFVNGVLRSIAREEKKVSFSISEKYSMPEWIVEDFTERFGKEKTEEILAAFLNAHDTTIRTNTAVVSPEELRAHLEAEGVTVKPVKELPYAFQISDYDHLSSLKAFQDGEFYIQDLSSMMVAERAGVKANQEVLDVCAAPGGKSLHVAELLKGTGSVRSRDLTEMKVDLIRENIERSNMKNMVAEVWDARELDEKLMDKEDIVIADLPCSGLGIIGKKPDIKYRITREDQESLQALQREILSTVHQYVKPGGTLVFSTCTICKLENEDNVEWFQEQFKDFTLESMEQILPGKDYMDGFFISVFKRK